MYLYIVECGVSTGTGTAKEWMMYAECVFTFCILFSRTSEGIELWKMMEFILSQLPFIVISLSLSVCPPHHIFYCSHTLYLFIWILFVCMYIVSPISVVGVGEQLLLYKLYIHAIYPIYLCTYYKTYFYCQSLLRLLT